MGSVEGESERGVMHGESLAIEEASGRRTGDEFAETDEGV